MNVFEFGGFCYVIQLIFRLLWQTPALVREFLRFEFGGFCYVKQLIFPTAVANAHAMFIARFAR